PAPFPDPVLIAEPGGADTYTGTAGSANPTGLFVPGGGAGGGNALALSVVADLAGDDHYTYTGEPNAVQGSGSIGGLGVLGVAAGLWGNDQWLSTGVGLTGGSDCWGGNSGDAFQGLYPQGVGLYAGVGIMTDSGFGNDVYLNHNHATTTDYYAQGFG